jgi:type II secretory pathway pseudopilin PulG
MNATTPSRSLHRLLLPALFVIILGGLASPFILAARKQRQLAANETALLALLKNYANAQDAAFQSRGEYATSFEQLNLPEAFPDIDQLKSTPLSGYRFRILTSSGENSWLDSQGRLTKSFGLLAVPASYMVTGRDTFLMSGHDIYCVDFNIRTEQITQELRSFGIPRGAQKVSE